MHQHIKDSKLKIIVKPNSPKNKIIKWDSNKQALRVNIKAPPEKDKANKEVMKFFSKQLKKKVKIIKGLRSKEKVLSLS